MQKDLTKDKPSRLIVAFAISVLASSALNYIYGLTDSFMLSYFVSPNAIGAANSVSPVAEAVYGAFLSLVSGFSIVIGKAFGSGDDKRLTKFLGNSITVSAIISLPVTLICMLISNSLVSMMNTPETFYEDAYTYLLLSFLHLPISTFSAIFSGYLRAAGDSKTPTYISIISGFSNVIFNYVFLAIIPLGIAGAAIGTICAAIVGLVVNIIVMRRGFKQAISGLEDLKLDKITVISMFSCGIPMCLLSILTNVSNVILQIATNSFSEQVIIGISTGNRLVVLAWLIIMSFETAQVYFCAQNSGAGRIDRVREGNKTTFVITLVIAGIIAVLCIAFGKYFYRAFLSQADALEIDIMVKYASDYVIYQFAFFPFIAMLSSFRGTIKGIGETRATVFVGIIELICRIIVSLVSVKSSFGTEVKLSVLYLAGPMSWVFASIFLVVVMIRALKNLDAKISTIHQKNNAEL